MATRRRYKERVEPIAVEPPIAPEVIPNDEPVLDIPEIAANPLIAQLAAVRHADELQRQAVQRQPQTIEQYIDAMPDLSDHKRSFLKQYPVMLDPAVSPIMARHYHKALQSGMKDDTADLDDYLLIHVMRDIEHHPHLQTPAEGAETLAQEADGYLAEYVADQRAAAPAPRRSMPMTAPVSREVPTASGERGTSASNTLSQAEREIARNSFTDPMMSNAQKEYLYLQNRQRLTRMRANGSYPQSERN